MSNAAAKLTVRVETKAQLERHRRAAKVKKWSINRFYLEAADKMTAEILETSKVEHSPLMVSDIRHPLNQ